MKFGNKKIGLILGGVGLAITATGAGLLGAGTNATYSQEIPGSKVTMKVGIGSLNYGKAWVNGEEQKFDNQKKQSYSDAIKDIRKNYDDVKKMANTGNESSKSTLKMFDEVLKANDMMISGAVLTSIFSVVLIVGTVMFFLNKKKS